ncbi:hypothetical protein KRMM14A1259_73100 [Krasilnikovia sp. MM14-A1259]
MRQPPRRPAANTRKEPHMSTDQQQTPPALPAPVIRPLPETDTGTLSNPDGNPSGD